MAHGSRLDQQLVSARAPRRLKGQRGRGTVSAEVNEGQEGGVREGPHVEHGEGGCGERPALGGHRRGQQPRSASKEVMPPRTGRGSRSHQKVPERMQRAGACGKQREGGVHHE